MHRGARSFDPHVAYSRVALTCRVCGGAGGAVPRRGGKQSPESFSLLELAAQQLAEAADAAAGEKAAPAAEDLDVTAVEDAAAAAEEQLNKETEAHLAEAAAMRVFEAGMRSVQPPPRLEHGRRCSSRRVAWCFLVRSDGLGWMDQGLGRVAHKGLFAWLLVG